MCIDGLFDSLITLSFLLNVLNNLLLDIIKSWFERTEANVLTLLVLFKLPILFKIGKSLCWRWFIGTSVLIDHLLGNFLMVIFLTHNAWFLKLSYLVCVFLLEIESLLA